MKKLVGVAAAAAVVVSLGLAPAGAPAGDAVKVRTTVTAEYDARGSTAPSWDVAAFLGEVRSDVKKCRKGRTVKAREVDGARVGSAESEKGGNFEIDAAGFGPGTYKLTVAKRTVRVDGERTVCRPAGVKVVAAAG